MHKRFIHKLNLPSKFISIRHSKCMIFPLARWRHQMEKNSALLAICAGNSPVPVNSPHKGQWRGALVFSLISAWINGWVNNLEAGDMRRNPTIMTWLSWGSIVPFSYYDKFSAPFQIHWWIQTAVTIRKRTFRVKTATFFPMWPWNFMDDPEKQ